MKSLLLILLSVGLLSACEQNKKESSEFEGQWVSIDSEPGEQTYFDISASGEVFYCSADIKNAFKTQINGENKLEPYGYGGGDQLSIEDGVLIRTGSEKDYVYQARYERVSTLPDWCLEQALN